MSDLIKHISGKEEELSNYSDKLRQAVIKVFETFGDPNECRICGLWKHPREQTHPLEDSHPFTPRIRLSLDVEGPTYYKDEWRDKERKLASRHGMLVILETTFSGENIFHPNQVSREELKEIVRERRILEFLNIYLQKLEQKTSEYMEISKIAEKLASVLG